MYHTSLHKRKIKTAIKEIGIEIKFNELGNNLNMRLIKKNKNYILNNAEYISNVKSFRIKPIDQSLKNKRKTYCFELLFGIISLSSYSNIETMNIISSDVVCKLG